MSSFSSVKLLALSLIVWSSFLSASIKSERTPDTTVKWDLINTQKLAYETQYEAIEAALSKLLAKPPPMGRLIAHTAQSGPVRAWASGECYNEAEDEEEYKRVCRSCLSYLIHKRIFGVSADWPEGRQIMTTDCYIRYELYELTNETPIIPPESPNQCQ